MNIIVDAMGGDNAPREIVRGAVDAAEMFKTNITLVGNKRIVEKLAAETGKPLGRIDVVHADTVIEMEDDPMSVVRSKKDSSMAVGLRLLKEGGDAFVSAGNTGALHAGGSLIIRSVPGINRAAIAAILPFKKPILLIDCGANINVTADYLLQWAMMGSVYMSKLFGMKKPRIGLLNNGTEETKGTTICVDAYAKLKASKYINFVGNIESREIPNSPCDVLVTDGFTGNIVLKLVEGMGKFMFTTLQDVYMTNTVSKISFLGVKNHLRKLKHELDASEYGGAPLLGLNKPVIKAHGSSDARAFRNAVGQAIKFADTGVVKNISSVITEMKNCD